MQLVTKRDMEDAKGLGERSGLNMMDDWDEFIHDVAQTIANGRRAPSPENCEAPNGAGHTTADCPGVECKRTGQCQVA